MKRSFVIVALLCSSVFAVDRTVKIAGGGTCTAIQTCVNLMAAGDTTTVYAGDYRAEGVITITAGTAGNLKTLQANGNDLVNIAGLDIDSYVSIIGGSALNPTSTGFHLGDPSSPMANPCLVIASAAIGWSLLNSNLTACGTSGGNYGMIPFPVTNWSYGIIRGNTFSYGPSTSASPNVGNAIFLYCDYCLVELNDFPHLMQAGQIRGSYQWWRKNTFGPVYGRDTLNVPFPAHDCIATLVGTTADITGTDTLTWVSGYNFANEAPGMWVSIGGIHYTVTTKVSDNVIKVSGSPANGTGVAIGGGVGGNCHGELLFGQAGADIHHIVMEDNFLQKSLGHDNKVALFQANGAHTYGPAIVRFNRGWNVTGAAIDNNSGTTPGFPRVCVYNNTWAGTGTNLFAEGFTVSAHVWGADNACQINNGTYFDGTVVAFVGVNPSACDFGGGSSDCATFTNHNNRAWDTGGNCGTYCYGQVYQTGLFTDIVTNKVTNPQFVNFAIGDLRLSGGSEWIGSGSYLTTVIGGCGTPTIEVRNSDPFQAGDTTLGVLPDGIRVGATNTYTISSIGDSTHITATGNIACSAGDGVYLYTDSSGTQQLFAANPDIGALQSAAPVPTISNFARAADVIKGGTATLNLASTDATTALISDGTSTWSMSVNGSLVVTPSCPRTGYTPTLTGPGGTTVGSTIYVNVGGCGILGTVKGKR